MGESPSSRTSWTRKEPGCGSRRSGEAYKYAQCHRALRFSGRSRQVGFSGNHPWFALVGYALLAASIGNPPSTIEETRETLERARVLQSLQGIGWIVVGIGLSIALLGISKSQFAIDAKSEIMIGRTRPAVHQSRSDRSGNPSKGSSWECDCRLREAGRASARCHQRYISDGGSDGAGGGPAPVGPWPLAIAMTLSPRTITVTTS